MYMIIYEKYIIFDIAYGKMHELLARKDKRIWFHHLTMYLSYLCYYLEIFKDALS